MNLSRRELVAVVILLSLFVSIFLFPLTRAVPKPSPNLGLDDFPSTFSYVVKTDGLGVYWMTDSTGHEAFWSDNLTKVEQFALGNVTSGTVYLMQVQHNSSLTVPANVMVIEDYQGRLDFFGAQFYWAGSNRTDSLANPISSFNYIIDLSGSTYRLKNGTDWQIPYQSTNLTKVEQFALGNMTTGLLYLKEVAHNASLSISATQIVAQQYSGKLTYFTDTGSSSVTDCPVATTGNFTFPSGTGETTILTLATPASITKLHNLYIDLSVLTQNCTLYVYSNFTGEYKKMSSMTVAVGAGNDILVLKEMMINWALKLTIQSAVAEGATRYLYYQYFAETY